MRLLFSRAAALLGLPAGLPLIPGARDGALANIGSGATGPDTLAITIGTSAALRMTLHQPVTGAAMRTFCYRLDDRLFFANAHYVQGRIREAVAGAGPVEWFVLDAEGLVGVDSSGTEALRAIHRELGAAGVGFAVARLKAPVLERFAAAGLVALIGPDRFHPTVAEAVESVPPGWADADQDGRR